MEIKHLALNLLILFSLSACGGGSSKDAQGNSKDSGPASSPAVPSVPASDPMALLGPDADKNGIRDDVDLQIASNWSSDVALKTAIVAIAKDYQSYLAVDLSKTPDTSEFLASSAHAAECSVQAVGDAQLDTFRDAESRVFAKTFNSAERLQKYTDVTKAAKTPPVELNWQADCGSAK